MNKLSKKQRYFVTGLALFAAAFPLVTSQTFDASLTGSTVAVVPHELAAENRDNYRQERRDYADAIDLCQKLRADGKDVTCPDINDRAGILYLLQNHENLPQHGAATETGAVVLHVSDLTPYQFNLIRWYQRINTCPDTMKDYLPGFYDLCVSMLNPRPMLLQGLTGPDDNGDSTFTLDEFIKANKKSLPY